MAEVDRLQEARDDFWAYMAIVHETDMPDVYGGAAVPFAHHEVMIEALADDSLGHTLIVEPRGAAKTTIVRAFLEWDIGQKSLSGDRSWAAHHRILYGSHKEPQATKASIAMRTTIAGKLYQAIFPKVKPYAAKWGEVEWRLQGNETQEHPTFQAFGIESPPLGARGDRIVLDDIGNAQNMATPGLREKIRDTLDEVVMPMLAPGGRVIMPCTRWAWDDPADWAAKQGFHIIYVKALQEEDDDGDRGIGGQGDARAHDAAEGRSDQEHTRARGQADGEGDALGTGGTPRYRSYWPARFPVATLLKLKEQNARAFARQYQNEVAPEEGQAFLREWFEPRFDYVPSEVLFTANSWDTAAAVGRNRSYSAGWSAAITPDWHIYLFHLIRGQVLYPYLREAVKMLAERDRARVVIIEKKSSGHQLVDEFNIAAARGEIGWHVEAWQPAGQKGSPTRREYNEVISEVCAHGRVHLPSDYYCRKSGDADWLVDAENEIFAYPDGNSDDIVDALCQLIYYVRNQEQHAIDWLGRPAEPTPWVTSPGERRYIG